MLTIFQQMAVFVGMIENLLNQLGLAKKEREIYRIVLECGAVTPAQISKRSKINRTTVYSVAKELIAKGLMVECMGGKITSFRVSSPLELKKVIRAGYQKVKEKEHAFSELEEYLKSLPESFANKAPKIRYIEESELEEYLYDSFPRWVEKSGEGDGIFYGFQDHTFVEKYEQWIDWSWKNSPHGFALRLLTNDSEIEKKMRDKHYSNKRHIAFLTDTQFTASQWVSGSYVIYVITKQRPFYLIEIHDAVVAQNTKELLKNAWNGAKKQ